MTYHVEKLGVKSLSKMQSQVDSIDLYCEENDGGGQGIPDDIDG